VIDSRRTDEKKQGFEVQPALLHPPSPEDRIKRLQEM